MLLLLRLIKLIANVETNSYISEKFNCITLHYDNNTSVYVSIHRKTDV